MAECLRTRVQFPPSPPNNETTLAVVFLFVDLVLDLRRYGFTKIAGSDFECAFYAQPRRGEAHDVPNNSRHLYQ
jgi:hypothetical protein